MRSSLDAFGRRITCEAWTLTTNAAALTRVRRSLWGVTTRYDTSLMMRSKSCSMRDSMLLDAAILVPSERKKHEAINFPDPSRGSNESTDQFRPFPALDARDKVMDPVYYRWFWWRRDRCRDPRSESAASGRRPSAWWASARTDCKVGSRRNMFIEQSITQISPNE